MASKICATCLGTLQRQSRSVPITHKSTLLKSSRAFTTCSSQRAAVPVSGTSSKTSKGSSSPSSDKPSKSEAATPTRVKVAEELRRVTGHGLDTYSAYGAMDVLYKECARQANYMIPRAKEDEEVPRTEDGEDLGVGETWWHTELGLKPTFSTWSQVTMLHMYLLAARIRCFKIQPPRSYQQHLLDHFFHDAENKMAIVHNLHASSIRNRYLKDLFVQWRGLLAAYDEGLAKGDAVLAAAVWRNVFKASEDVDVKRLAQIVAFMRSTLMSLDAADDEVIMNAAVKFRSPAGEAGVVSLRSKMMDVPFERAPGKVFSTGKQG